MKSWHEGLPEATEFSVFPPAGEVRSWTADRERTSALLSQALPGLTFVVADISLGADAKIIPILGEAGEGGRGIYAAPPSSQRAREIERALASFTLAGSQPQ